MFASNAESANSPISAEKIDAFFSSWNKPDSPGCAAGIDRYDGSSMVRGYGVADLEHNVAIDPDTVFEAGSVSKQFTAAAILILVEQRKLALDDDVRNYIPALPDYGARITIADLLGHTSGLRDWEGIVDLAGWPVTTRAYTVNDVLEIAERQRSLNHIPGAEFSYTNTGYILLVAIMEQVSGESFAQFTREHLFVPADMRNTQWRDDFRAIVTKRAIAYDRNAGSYRQLMPFESVIGAGGLLTTVGDLLKWNRALDSSALGKFVTTELQRPSTLRDGRKTAYARGLEIADDQGIRKIFHAGETGGYEAFLARYPDQHVSVALLCNAGSGVDVNALGDNVAGLMVASASQQDRSNHAVSTRLKLNAEQLQPYVGEFFDTQLAVKMQLTVKDGELRRATDGLLLTPVSLGKFRTTNSIIRFIDHDHIARDFDDGRQWAFSRITPWNPKKEELSEFAGRYSSDEAQATYDITAVGDHLNIALDDRRWNSTILEPVAVDTFTKPHHAYKFIRDANGRVSSVVVSDGWEHVYALSFRRIADDRDVQGGH